MEKDAELKKLVEALEKHCKSKGYNFVVSVDEDGTEESAIAYNGSTESIVANVAAYALHMEEVTGEEFVKILLAVLMNAKLSQENSGKSKYVH